MQIPKENSDLLWHFRLIRVILIDQFSNIVMLIITEWEALKVTDEASYVVRLVMLWELIALHIILKIKIHHPYNSFYSHLIPALVSEQLDSILWENCLKVVFSYQIRGEKTMPRTVVRIKRPCRICRRWFTPNPRLKDRQKTCGDALCKREWHRKKCSAWNKENTDYYRTNYLQKKLDEATGTKKTSKILPVKSRLNTGLPHGFVQEVIDFERLWKVFPSHD